MKGEFLIAMDGSGRLHFYGVDGGWHHLYPTGGTIPAAPYIFDGSECMTGECLPAWVLDAYYSDKLPKSFRKVCRS